MKRLIFAALLLTFASGACADPVPQAIWCSGNTTLYFTYAEPVTQGSSYGGQTADRVYSGDGFYYGNLAEDPGISSTCTTVVFESSFASVLPTNCTNLFVNLGALTNIQGIENLNTSEVTSMGSMFAKCGKLTSLDLSLFNTAKVTDMESMFQGCAGLTALDLSSFDTSNVTNMIKMFSGCSALTTLTVATGWSKISSYSDRFKNCSPSTMNLVMDNDRSSQSLLEEFDELISGKAVNVTLRNRKLYCDGRWNTLCLPFNTSLTGDLADATVKTLTSSSFANGTLTLNFSDVSPSGEQGGAIEAGKPYIVKWGTPQENISSPEFHGVTINNTTNNVETDFVDFVGSYEPVNIVGEDKAILYMGANSTLYYPDQAMTIGSFRAYFRLQGIEAGDPAVSAIELNFEDGETTGVRPPSISPEGENTEASPQGGLVGVSWYSLDGRKLNGKPTQKGIYIVNGRKVVIK